MEFKIEPVERFKVKQYPEEDYRIASDFAKKVYKEFGAFIKAIVLFGSAARRKGTEKSDVDVLVVVNDLTLTLSPEVVETYRVIMEKMISGEPTGRVHLTTLRFTNFWEFAMNGDPIVINILRDGIALLDTGFFDPLQALLFQGRIRPSYESIWTYQSRANNTIHNSKWHILQATLDLYWAVIDSAHAALMKIGEIPPSPTHVADMLREKLMLEKKLIGSKEVDTMQMFFELSKKIVKREIKEVSGSQFDDYHKRASHFVQIMKAIVEMKD